MVVTIMSIWFYVFWFFVAWKSTCGFPSFPNIQQKS
ncbi:MAG: hypothetical protein KatS3mg049_1751 [Caldilinea sp.]|nr:MAG: hypothetical protein KatS3mg049_1751 [Caldilinea sp.]